MLKALFLLLNAAKLGKILTTGGTILISVVAYAFVFGWKYAAGFVLLLFAHEMGHYVAARQRGLDVGVPTFIPFVGAWIQMKQMPHDVETEAYVGFAGPYVGTLAALACYGLARYYDSELLLALSYAGCFLNLFNLIPVSPLDGGRITAIISPRVWLLGVPILVAVFYFYPSPLLILLAILAAPQVMKAWKYDPDAPENAYYRNVSTESRIAYGMYYLGLTGFLAVMTAKLHEQLPGL